MTPAEVRAKIQLIERVRNERSIEERLAEEVIQRTSTIASILSQKQEFSQESTGELNRKVEEIVSEASHEIELQLDNLQKTVEGMKAVSVALQNEMRKGEAELKNAIAQKEYLSVELERLKMKLNNTSPPYMDRLVQLGQSPCIKAAGMQK